MGKVGFAGIGELRGAPLRRVKHGHSKFAFGKAMIARTVLRRIGRRFGKAVLRQVAGTHSEIAAGGTVSAVGWVLHVSSAAFAGFGATGGA